MSQRLRTAPRPDVSIAAVSTKSPSPRPSAWARLVTSLAVVLGVVGTGLWSPTAEAGAPLEGPALGGPGFGGLAPLGGPPPFSSQLAAPPGAGATIPIAPRKQPTPDSDPTADPTDPDDSDNLDPEAFRRHDPNALILEPPKLLTERNIPPFYFKREFDTHTTRALTLPPLFVHRTPKDGHPEKLFHMDLSFTFAYYAKVRDKRRWMNPLVLFFGGFSEQKSTWAALPLLMGYRRVGEQFNFGQFPLVWWWGNKHVKNLFVFPLHYHKKAPDQFFGASGLLFWYGNKDLDDDDVDNDRRHFVAAPIYFKFQHGPRTIHASPLYFGAKNLTKGTNHRTLLPFFHWQSREFGNRKELWTVAWIQRSDEARGRRAWALPPLLSFRTHTPDRDLMAITPLVWRHKNTLLDRTTWVAGIGGSIRDPNQQISWAAPLWWRFADKRNGASLSVLAPLAMWRRSPERIAVHTLVLSVWKNQGEAGRGGGGGSLPLLSWVHVSPLRSKQVLLAGLFWRSVDRDPTGTGSVDPAATRSAWGIGPLVYRSKLGRPGSPDSRARFGVPPLLTFVGRQGTKSHQVVTPLFWHFRDRDTDPSKQHDTFVVPPFYIQKRAQGFRFGLPPLFAAANDERYRYAVVPGLLFGHVEDKLLHTSRTISPLFVRTKTPTSRVLGAGVLAWDVRRDLPDTAEGSLGQRDSVLFPLYYRRQRGDRVIHMSPLGGVHHGPEGKTWVGALAYGFERSDRHGGGLLPILHHEVRTDATGATIGATTALFPLFLRDRRPERDLDVWTPLIWRAQVRGDKPRNNLAVVPFYFGQRQRDGVDVDASFFFVWSRDHTHETHTLVAGPFYHRLTRDKLITGLGPLSYWEDSLERRLLVIPPLVVSLENKVTRERTTVGIPLWFDRVQRSGKRVWMAFPFAVGVHRKHDFTRAGVAIPLYYDIHRLHKNYRFTGVVPFLFRYQKGGFQKHDAPEDRYTLWGSFPLFLHGKDGHGRRTHAALGLYWFDRTPEGFKFFTLLGGASHKPGKELSWYAPLIYRKVTNEQATTFVWPLFAYHKGYRKGADGRPYKDISTTWVLPPLFIGQHKEDRKWWQSALLVWQFKRPHKVTTTIAPPIFFLQDSYKERRLHWLLPLYVRDNNMGKGETWTSVLPALFVHHRSREHDNAVQFPLIWHFDNPKRRVTLGAFIWYDVERYERGVRTQVLPALYARRKTPQSIGHMIGPGLVTWRREAEGQPPAKHWRALFWLIGGGNENGERYMWLLGAKLKLKPKALAPKKVRKRRAKGKDAIDETPEPGAKPGAQPSAKPSAQLPAKQRRALRRATRRGAAQR